MTIFNLLTDRSQFDDQTLEMSSKICLPKNVTKITKKWNILKTLSYFFGM